MDAKQLIEAHRNRVPIMHLVEAIQSGRDQVSSLDTDTAEFLATMATEAKNALAVLESAVKTDNLEELVASAKSLQEICQMIEDSCSESS